MKIIRKAYDENYFHSFSTIIDRYQQALNTIYEHLDPGTIIELGCGDGTLASKIDNSYKIFGLDISEYAIKLARKKAPFGKFRKFDITTSNLPKIEHTGIIAFNILEHLKNPKVVLENVYTYLKSGEKLIYGVPNNFGLFGRFSTFLSNLLDRTHISTYERSKWLDISEEIGFKIIDVVDSSIFKRYKSKFGKHIASSFFVVLEKN